MTPVKAYMRSVPPAITISVLVHGVVIAVLATRSHDPADDAADHEPPQTEITIEEIDVPVEVALVDEAPAAAAVTPEAEREHTETRPSPASVTTTHHGATSARSASTSTSTSSTGEPRATVGTDEGKAMMKMRSGPELDMSLSPELMAKLANKEGHIELAPKPTGWLDPKSGGRFHIDDEVAQIDVKSDGTVKITSKPEFEVHLDLPSPDLSFIGDWWEQMRRDPEAFTRAGPPQELPAHEQAVPGQWDSGTNGNPDGNPIPKNHGTGGGGGIPILAGTADVTAWAMRKFLHKDAYDARKLKLLDDTRDERVYHGDRFRAEQLRRSAEMMRNNLEALWRATQDPAERRQALFEMWDECGEGEGQLGEAGERARVQVLGWIRARIPKGNAAAFSPTDIATLDGKRQSKQHFTPYE